VPSDAPRAWEHLFAAEGSDWFWWYGDDHWTGDRALFDQLFREHLLGVFDALGESAPRWLHVPVAALAERSDQVPPIGFVTPVVDGRRTEFYEWHTAGRARPGAGGSMHRDRRRMLEAFYGFDELRFVLRVDLAPGERSERAALAIAIAAPRPIRLVVGPLSQSRPAVERRDDEGAGHPMAGAIAAFEHVLELSVPFEALGLAAGERVEFALEWLEDGAPVESLPAHDLIRFSVPDRGWQDGMWSV
jgi:hypothetical protein